MSTCPPPFKSRPYAGKPQIETYLVPAGPSGGSNQRVTLTPPRHTILFKGNDKNGSTATVILTLNVAQGGGAAGGPSGFDALVGFNIGNLGILSFREPIDSFYISWNDTGQPGSNFVIQATDDVIAFAGTTGITVADTFASGF